MFSLLQWNNKINITLKVSTCLNLISMRNLAQSAGFKMDVKKYLSKERAWCMKLPAVTGYSQHFSHEIMKSMDYISFNLLDKYLLCAG